ncbi:MFS transporter [Pontivivens insulae]|uniref:Putative 3-phenylpropionic acid transporter n=1 Tax=Pontivivens insulae TaxID=1639689 RepID=A0A2R8A982_9RHOB|nr:MFS transporter [Pontivivens insulae]RED12700.1 PPP family 3-phenylpropionic acid transporter [Pontivivens insulae]SPF28791.1 putative 3-phenylpropionic acid transporter [Pontivivens insulae]
MPRPAALSQAGILTAATYAALFAALGAHLPFWPLWLEKWGLTATEIGTFTAAGMIVRVLAGLGVPALADKLGQRRLVLAGVAGFGVVAFAVHGLLADRAVLLIATLGTGVVFAGLIPIADALGTAAAREGGFAYAQVRSMGSLAFVLTNLACGWLIGQMGVVVAQWWIVICLALTVWLAIVHPGGGKVRDAEPARLADVGRMLIRREFMAFIGAIGLAQSSHAVLYAYGSLHWAALGVSEEVIGGLWAFAVAVEVVLMLVFGAALIRILGPVGAIALSAVAGIVRWGAMAFDPSGASLWLLQALHAFTFAAGHLGGIAFIAAAVPERLAASAQGMFSSAIGGILVALAMAGAAVVYPVAGGGTYWIAFAMSCGGLILAGVLHKVWRR